MKGNRGIVQTAAAFALGATTGGILTLLYAPASGKNTRRRLVMRVRGFGRAAARRIDRTQRVLVGKAEEVREAATDWISTHVPLHNGNGRHAIRRRPVRRTAAHAH